MPDCGGKKANPAIIFTRRKANRAAGYAEHCGPMQNPSGAYKNVPGAWSGEDARSQQLGAVQDGVGETQGSHTEQHIGVIYIFFLFLSLFFLFFNQSGIKARARTETSALSPPPRFSSAVRANERRPLYFFFF